MKLGFYFNTIFLNHVNLHSPIHPESPERLKHIIHTLERSDLFPDLVHKTPIRDDAFFVKKTHCYKHFDELYQKLNLQKTGQIDKDTFFSENTLKAALISANTGCEAARDMIEKKELFTRAFCCIRPPGHHAEEKSCMGFCLFNNVAVTANYLKFKGFSRILIVDFDAHHGNGTQSFFYNDNEVFFISLHQEGIYPNSGHTDQFGEGRGEGYTINIPLTKGSDITDFLEKFDFDIKQRISDWQPEVLLFSSGFDGHEDDTISDLQFKSTDYYKLTTLFMELLPKKETPVISFLEGGYQLSALAESVYFHLKALKEF